MISISTTTAVSNAPTIQPTSGPGTSKGANAWNEKEGRSRRSTPESPRTNYFGLTVVQWELRHLRNFVAVAEALSFTKAAQKLRLAQLPLERHSTIAWRADNTSKQLKDYIQIVNELSAGMATTSTIKEGEWDRMNQRPVPVGIAVLN